ncbi:MAG: RNA methyltransferase [Anaerolineae bacterium]|nr:RNA methyltransferase [Anaerolineae bacterium]
MITSLKNAQVRRVRALQQRRRTRQREGALVVEGLRLCEEAVQAHVVPEFYFYVDEGEPDARAQAVLQAWQDVPGWPVSPAVMAACSDTETPQGLLAVVPLPAISPPLQPTMTLVLDQVRDPGNLGTILRTALAAGVDQVLLAPGTVDATNPKVVRAAMGAHFRLSWAAMGWEAIAAAVAACRVYLAAPRGAVSYTDVDWCEAAALVVGGEAAGAGRHARALAAVEIAIPMAGEAESLNAAVSAAVILFEALRQRRASHASTWQGDET